MKRNNVIYLCLFLSILILPSCSKDPQTLNALSDESSIPIALEIHTHSYTITESTPIDPNIHSEFMGPDVIRMIGENPNRSRSTKGKGGVIDTIFYYEQIPIFKEERSKQIVYVDGTSESEHVTIVDPETNPVLTFSEVVTKIEDLIYKVVVKRGVRKIYNSRGDLIKQTTVVQSDLKTFIDSLQYYYDKKQEHDALKSQITAIERIRKQVANGQKMLVSETYNGNIMLEQEYTTSQYPGASPLAKSNSIIKTKTEISPQADRTLSYELRSGDQLIERRRYTYTNNQPKLKNRCIESDDSHENPETIHSQRLVVMGNGTPMIRTIEVKYEQNQTIFHPNRK